jgi:hypothetical protein
MLLLTEKLVQDIYDRLAQETYSSVATLISRLKSEVENQPARDQATPPPPPQEQANTEVKDG